MTGLILLGVLTLLITYDIWAYIHRSKVKTISWWMFTTAHKHPILPFVMGVLVGHFFWGQEKG